MWTWAGASVRGTSHMRTGTRRQDAYRCLARDDRLVVAVCDGAGSASHGGEGAALAAWLVTQAAQRNAGAALPVNEMVASWIDHVRDAIAAVAMRRGRTPRDFATTLVLVIATPDGVLSAQIGDGAAIGRCAETGDWQALSWPEHGEYASMTYFVTDDAGARLRIARHAAGFDRIAVLTDGIERLALDFAASTPHRPFFEGISAPVAASSAIARDRALSAALSAYLDSDAINARTDDDKTLVVACRR